MSSAQPYQLLPPLSDDEFKALEASIIQHGVLVPVEYDEDGNILDGHHRVAICESLGISDFPRVVRVGLSDSQKRTHSRALNLARRHLTTFQKRAIIEAQLRETPQLSNRAIGQMLSVDKQTIRSRREALEAEGRLKRPKKTIGLNGVMQPSRRARLPQSPLLSDGGRLADLRVYDVVRRIRECEHDLSLLRAVLVRGEASNDASFVRDVIPASLLAQMAGGDE